jgi:hypothetical protein
LSVALTGTVDNKRFRDIDDTANDADINLSCEVNIIANANDILVHLLKYQVNALKCLRY